MYRSTLRLLALGLVLLLQACGSPPSSIPPPSNEPEDNPPILISDNGDHFGLTVSLSDITMSLPKGAFRKAANNRSGATASRRYFYFTSSDAVVSGWFEGAAKFTDLRGRWQVEMNGLRQRGFPAPTQVEDVKVGQMTGILYTYEQARGSSSHLRSTYLSSGTWVDLHLSFTANVAPTESRAQVLALARSITFSPKVAK